MARWLQLSLAGSDEPVFVNVENVTHLRPRGEGTRLYFVGGQETSIVVTEEPAHIIDMDPLEK